MTRVGSFNNNSDTLIERFLSLELRGNNVENCSYVLGDFKVLRC